jgi:hypothetical protein
VHEGPNALPDVPVPILKPKKAERRRWMRYAFNVPVRLISESTVIHARCIRMSEGGIYLFAAANLELGKKVQVDFDHNDAQSRNGIVRNRAAYLYGVEFSDSPGPGAMA